MDEKNKFETEINFIDLLKSPSRLFGWIFPYYLVLFLVVGIFFVKNMEFASVNSIKPDYTDSLDVKVEVQVKKGGIMPAIDLALLREPSNDIITKGKQLFSTNCASCHGNEGKGDGVAAAVLNPAPRNFNELEGWKNGRDFNAMYKTLQEGIAGGGMIAYEFLPIEDRIAIIHYMRTLTEFPKISEESITELDRKYELSKGIIAPNNITLEMAAEKISSESSKFSADIDILLDKINNSTNKAGVEIFNSVIENKEKVIEIFKRDYLKNSNSDKFINQVVVYPSQSGFKSSVSLLSKKELEDLFNLLRNSLS